MGRLMKDVSALNSSLTASLRAPAGFGGENAPVSGSSEDNTMRFKTVKAENSQTASRAKATDEAKAVLNVSVALIASGVVLLWVFGGLVFRNANL